MPWLESRVASAFDLFLDTWLIVEPLLFARVDELDVRGDAQGTVEDFSNLARVVDAALQCIALGLEPPVASVPRACVFVRLWPEPDELADRIKSLAEAYACAIEDLGRAVRDTPGGMGSAQQPESSDDGPARAVE